MNEPFLFEELETAPDPQPVKEYTTPIEQASFDIMELVDVYFKTSVTVETYDTIEKNVRKILTEAFCEKNDGLTSGGNRLLLVRPCASDDN